MKTKMMMKLLCIAVVTFSMASCSNEDDTVSQEEYLEYDTQIVLEGEDNFRDMGGFVGTNGKRILYRKLFRSGELSALTDNDKQIMLDLEISQLVDLRSASEIASKPNNVPSEIATYNLPLVLEDDSAVITIYEWLENVLSDDYDNEAEMLKAYNYIDAQRLEHWTAFFNLLETGNTTLWHCTGRQDRAGMTAALVLSSLGVDRDVIIEDYMATGEYLSEYFDQMAAYMSSAYGEEAGEAILANAGPREVYINTFFETIETEYGSVEAFLEVLDVDVAKMKEHFLEK